jgi:hypothetical protein
MATGGMYKRYRVTRTAWVVARSSKEAREKTNSLAMVRDIEVTELIDGEDSIMFMASDIADDANMQHPNESRPSGNKRAVRVMHG